MINLIFPIKVTIRSQVPTGPISFFFGPHKTQLSGTLAPHYAYLDNLGGLQIQRFLSSFLSSPSLSLSLFFFFFVVCLSCLCFILWDLMGGQPSIYNWCLYRGFVFFSFKTKHQNLSLSFALQYVFINHSPFQTQINNNTQRLYGRTQFHAIY